ncbi:hypothetical protein KM043_006124 [Ampulex compressa]|nr:hypothetical protein KM043_006124 [Ampulex compressa]
MPEWPEKIKRADKPRYPIKLSALSCLPGAIAMRKNEVGIAKLLGRLRLPAGGGGRDEVDKSRGRVWRSGREEARGEKEKGDAFDAPPCRRGARNLKGL